MISIVSFSTAMPVQPVTADGIDSSVDTAVYRNNHGLSPVWGGGSKNLHSLDGITTSISYWKEKYETSNNRIETAHRLDFFPVYEIISVLAETLKNQTEILNSLISPPPPPPSPSPPPPSPPPPTRCFHWKQLYGESRTQRLLCKLGI